jgi:hypothetical protein
MLRALLQIAQKFRNRHFEGGRITTLYETVYGLKNPEARKSRAGSSPAAGTISAIAHGASQDLHIA